MVISSPAKRKQSLEDRLENIGMYEPNSGCRLFLGALDRHGYGEMRYLGKTHMAHRLAYERSKGPIPDGYQIDHLCRNRACIAIEHLEAVTQRENWYRGQSPSALIFKSRMCSNGHVKTEGTIRVHTNPDGSTRYVCRTCNLEAVRRYKARKMAS